MPDSLTQLWHLAEAMVLLCPPLAGLVILSVVSRVIPVRWHLVYWTAGLFALTQVCRQIVRANPHPGPDPTVITSGLFAMVGTPLSLALAAVLVYRWVRTGSPLTESTPEPAAEV